MQGCSQARARPHQRDPVPELSQADADGRQRRTRVRRVPGQRAGVRQARQVGRCQHVLRLRPSRLSRPSLLPSNSRVRSRLG